MLYSHLSISVFSPEIIRDTINKCFLIELAFRPLKTLTLSYNCKNLLIRNQTEVDNGDTFI